MFRRSVAAAAILLSLAGCAVHHHVDADDTTGVTADSHAPQTSRETCFGGCTRDYNVCMDESSNSRESLPGVGALPTAGRGCGADLTGCQQRCRAL